MPAGSIHAQTTLFSEGFEDASLAARGWYDNTNPILSSVEHVAGSARSAEFRFLPGKTVAVNGGALRRKFPPTESVYLSFYIKYSANWVGSQQTYHPHQFHFTTNLDADWVGPSFTRMTAYVEENGGIPLLAIQDGVNIDQTRVNQNLVSITEQRSVCGCNGDSDGSGKSNCYLMDAAVGLYYNGKEWRAPQAYFTNTAGPRYKADWHHIEAYFKLNSIVNGVGIADGAVKYIYDGQTVIDRANLVLRTGAHPTMKYNQFILAPYLGPGSPVDQAFWVDNLIVGDALPGSPAPDALPPAKPKNLRAQ